MAGALKSKSPSSIENDTTPFAMRLIMAATLFQLFTTDWREAAILAQSQYQRLEISDWRLASLKVKSCMINVPLRRTVTGSERRRG